MTGLPGVLTRIFSPVIRLNPFILSLLSLLLRVLRAVFDVRNSLTALARSLQQMAYLIS